MTEPPVGNITGAHPNEQGAPGTQDNQKTELPLDLTNPFAAKDGEDKLYKIPIKFSEVSCRILNFRAMIDPIAFMYHVKLAKAQHLAKAQQAQQAEEEAVAEDLEAEARAAAAAAKETEKEAAQDPLEVAEAEEEAAQEAAVAKQAEVPTIDSDLARASKIFLDGLIKDIDKILTKLRQMHFDFWQAVFIACEQGLPALIDPAGSSDSAPNPNLPRTDRRAYVLQQINIIKPVEKKGKELDAALDRVIEELDSTLYSLENSSFWLVVSKFENKSMFIGPHLEDLFAEGDPFHIYIYLIARCCRALMSNFQVITLRLRRWMHQVRQICMCCAS
ncbi:hypothetical protein MPSEU_000874000 [Mayamaea pseudoterrestris]|nr:hypothetical protein MPSEU_000874000 [Mayamaea pseudoterrestris]